MVILDVKRRKGGKLRTEFLKAHVSFHFCSFCSSREVGFGFCNACLAFANEISLDDAQRVADYLQRLPEFERFAAGACSVCARAMKPVISAMGSARDEPARDHDVNTVEGGASTCWRTGWRWDGARSS